MNRLTRFLDTIRSRRAVKKEENKMAHIAMAAPWYTLYKKFLAMFDDDNEVRVLMSPECDEIKLYIDNSVKCAALEKLLVPEHQFGGKTVRIVCVPSNPKGVKEVKDDPESLWNAAFEGNNVFSFIAMPYTPFGSIVYVVFANCVVQFFNDDLSDVYGNCTTLYQDIAAEIFAREHSENFCTEPAKVFGQSPANWP